MSEHDAVLFTNEAFYLAFNGKDMAAMEEVWAEEAPLRCIHPGWECLEGREEVLESWRRILGGGASPAVTCRDARATIYGEAAFVVCYEEIEGEFLIATNYFVREGGRWRMVHHQAGPTRGRPREEPQAEAPRVN